MSIHKTQRYDETELRDVVSDFDLRHAWSIFVRHVQKPEATVLIVHPAKKIPKNSYKNSDLKQLTIDKFNNSYEKLNYLLKQILTYNFDSLILVLRCHFKYSILEHFLIFFLYYLLLLS